MQYIEKRKKSFLHSFTWIGIMLLAMGVVFMGIAVFVQLIPISPESINVYSNGIPQPSTEETVRTFRLIFLLSFGIIGLGLAISGGIVIWRNLAQRKLANRLREEGVRITAEVMGYSPSVLHVNYRTLERLQCAYTDLSGKIYIFKSGLLRIDPVPYLPEGKVNVYHDRENVRRYFVDVDGSTGLGDRVVEL